MRQKRVFLIIFLLVGLVLIRFTHSYFSDESAKISDALLRLYPAATPELIVKEGKLWQVYDQQSPDTPSHYVFLTTDYHPLIKGYAGAIKVLVGMDVKGRLDGIALISHNETPSYVYEIEDFAFAAQFEGKDIRDSFEFGGDLDAITQATITSTAIYQSVKNAARTVAREKLGISWPLDKVKIPWRGFLRSPAPYLLAAIFCLAVYNFYYPAANFRYLIMFFSIAYLGFYQQNYFSIFQVINILALRFPSFSNLIWYELIGLVLIVTILFGRIYCGHICPFGCLSEFLYLSNPYHLPLAAKYDKIMREFKYYLFVAVTLIAYAFTRLEVASFEPFKSVFSLSMTGLVGGLSGLILLASLVNYRFWCKYFCPAGAFMALLSMLSLQRYRILHSCDECSVCGLTCYQKGEECGLAIVGAPDNAECITCGRCLEGCPKQAIGVGFR